VRPRVRRLAKPLLWLGSEMRAIPGFLTAVLLFASSGLALAQGAAPPDGGVTFRSGVDLVTINAVVRNRKGQVVTDLGRFDFEVYDSGQRRAIASFRPDRAPVSVALLLDASGSMQVASNIDKARAAAQQLLAWLKPGSDEVAIYSFDTALHELQAFAKQGAAPGAGETLEAISPFGMTSLHDAIAATAEATALRSNLHRAVVVFTDGVDNNSSLTPPEVSGIASSIDVPVYIVAVVSPLDHPGLASEVRTDRPLPVGDLADLARWTGGDFFVSSAPAHTSIAAREIVSELRHQYVIAFEPAASRGWHPLEVRTRQADMVVRARGGYMAGPRFED